MVYKDSKQKKLYLGINFLKYRFWDWEIISIGLWSMSTWAQKFPTHNYIYQKFDLLKHWIDIQAIRFCLHFGIINSFHLEILFIYNDVVLHGIEQ